MLLDLTRTAENRPTERSDGSEVYGRLVPLGFAIAGFTPVAYQRGNLPRPLEEVSS